MFGQRGRSDVEVLKEFNISVGIVVKGLIWGLCKSQRREDLHQEEAKE
jgi:hypothetical protein